MAHLGGSCKVHLVMLSFFVAVLCLLTLPVRQRGAVLLDYLHNPSVWICSCLRI